MIVSDEMKKVMTDAAKEAAPREACGVVAGGVCYRLPNHEEDDESFHIRGADIAVVAAGHGGYEAVWHTHPSGNLAPSGADLANHPSGKAMLIASRTAVAVYYP